MRVIQGHLQLLTQVSSFVTSFIKTPDTCGRKKSSETEVASEDFRFINLFVQLQVQILVR